MTQICEEWAEKEKVNLTIDYLSTQGNKLYLTIAAEALARAGHDIMDLGAQTGARRQSPRQIYSQAIMPKMILRISQGEPSSKTLEWAS